MEARTKVKGAWRNSSPDDVREPSGDASAFLFRLGSGAPLFAAADHFGEVPSRPDLERPGLHPRVLRHQLNGVIQVAGFENENPPELLFRFGVGTVGDRHLAILPTQGRGRLRTLQR